MEVQKEKKRNKAQSKQRFLDAVETLLIEKGYGALKVNDIAATAGLDKKLIYNYFGGTDQLIDEYIRSKDFWSNVKNEKVPSVKEDGGERFVKETLVSQYEYGFKDKAFQKLMLWRISERRETLQKLTENQEAVGEMLFKQVIEPHFKDQTAEIRAMMAVLVSGAYHLNLFSAVNNGTFCGIDLNTGEGKQAIEKAFESFVTMIYANAKP